jgi:dTDP-4-amino-4,6-dideoxy-D-galactose acyltransferase
MDGPVPCRFLEWDSEFFRLRIASVSTPGLDREAMERALRWCRENRIECLYLLADAGDLVTRSLAEKREFRLTDVRVTLELEPVPGVADGRAGLPPRTRLAKPSDVPDLRAIAAASHTLSRFFNDGRFDRARCAELYATWIEKSCHGWAQAVWVAEVEARAAGYLTCHLRDGGRGEIGLVAVGAAAQGKGLGRELVARGLAWFREQGCARVSVVTQGANVDAQRLYQAAGFRTLSVHLWYHLWLDHTAGERA